MTVLIQKQGRPETLMFAGLDVDPDHITYNELLYILGFRDEEVCEAGLARFGKRQAVLVVLA